MDAIIQGLVDFFSNVIPDWLTVFVISLCPVLELRGGLIAAKLLHMDLIRAFAVCYIGNMIPIPFILLFIRQIFKWMRKSKHLGKLIDRLEAKADKHRDKIEKYGVWGLLLLVAIPLPGTGGWTGALVAAVMDLRIRRALPVIAIGVLIAGIIVGSIMYGLLGSVI